MKSKLFPIVILCMSLFSLIIRTTPADDMEKADEPHQPHTPTLIFYLSGAENQKDADAIRTSVQKLKSAATININTNRSYVRVRFDSHVVSYHQDCPGPSATPVPCRASTMTPALIIIVFQEYSQTNNAAKGGRHFCGKTEKLNTRVTPSKPLDERKGQFFGFFLPLKLEKTVTGPPRTSTADICIIRSATRRREGIRIGLYLCC